MILKTCTSSERSSSIGYTDYRLMFPSKLPGSIGAPDPRRTNPALQVNPQMSQPPDSMQPARHRTTRRPQSSTDCPQIWLIAT
uniref:Uncharacterized protein n=1 Tax=Panagrellus redivivus TaxID=6233 RepID=A0A7E4VCB1_PANRE